MTDPFFPFQTGKVNAAPSREAKNFFAVNQNPYMVLYLYGDICRAIDMDRSYMSAIEGGKVNVTIAVLEKLANALDVSVDELLK